jgi:hypothetical protein
MINLNVSAGVTGDKAPGSRHVHVLCRCTVCASIGSWEMHVGEAGDAVAPGIGFVLQQRPVLDGQPQHYGNGRGRTPSRL